MTAERREQLRQEARREAEGAAEPDLRTQVVEDRRRATAGALATDTATCEALFEGLPVPRHRLDRAALERSRLSLEGEDVVLDDALALRVEMSRQIGKSEPTTARARPVTARSREKRQRRLVTIPASEIAM
jgi:hypothetical protein